MASQKPTDPLPSGNSQAALLSTKTYDIRELPRRIRNPLHAYKTVLELLDLPFQEALKIRNFGDISFQKLTKVLYDLGITNLNKYPLFARPLMRGPEQARWKNIFEGLEKELGIN